MNTIVLFEDGSWNWIDFTSVMELGLQRHVEIKIGDNWTDRDVSDMLKEYMEENSDQIFL